MILDTNALSALMQGDRSLRRVLETVPRVAVTLISLGELEYGIRGSSRPEALVRWREAFLERADVLLPDLRTIGPYGDIRAELKRAGTPIPANDVWIAALVRQHAMPLASRDRHFDKVAGLVRVEW